MGYIDALVENFKELVDTLETYDQFNSAQKLLESMGPDVVGEEYGNLLQSLEEKIESALLPMPI